MPRIAPLVTCVALLLAVPPARASEPDWYELHSSHFLVYANVGERDARAVAWRFEQARSAIAAMCPWARVDLPKPIVVLAVRDEASMKALVPSYWEDKRSLHPTAVWFEGPNRYYVALRADLRDESQSDSRIPQNPYQMAYFAYIHVILQASFPGALPPWFSRGVAAVLSNTIVQEDTLVVGAPILTHVNLLRTHQPVPLRTLLAMSADDPVLKQEDRLIAFDASAWSFVHFLLFADNAARRARVDTLAALLQNGIRPAAAIEQSFGVIEKLQDEYGRYVGRSIFQYQKNSLDATVKREAFPLTRMAPAEAASMRGAFYAVTRRTSEAQRAIADARQLDANAASSYLAEALLLDVTGQQAPAQAAYEKAIAHGTDDAYAYYRCALLSWPANDDKETWARLDSWLAEAIRRNTRFAAAYAALARVRAALTAAADASVPLALRAIELEPTVSGHRWSAAALYLTLRQFDKARAEAQNALKLARTSEEQRAANDLLASIDAARTAASADEARAREAADAEKQATEANARVTACNGGDAAACTALVPSLESRCGDKEAGACGMLGWLYENGRGVTADATQAVKWYRLSCDSGEPRGCMAFALMQAHGQGVPKDVSAALELLDKICTGSLPQACTQEGVLLASRQKATDLARIRSLLDAGCKGGDTPACDLLKSLPYRQ